jgi:hypothetical protein
VKIAEVRHGALRNGFKVEPSADIHTVAVLFVERGVGCVNMTMVEGFAAATDEFKRIVFAFGAELGAGNKLRMCCWS